MLDSLTAKSFQLRFVSHAQAILSVDFPDAVAQIETALDRLVIPIEELIRGGGGEAKLTQRLRRAFADLGWTKRKFEIKKFINAVEKQAISHEVDHVHESKKGLIALEIEWNNKDPFFDRDLENFKRLHAEGAISVGVIVTRGAELQAQIDALVLDFAQHRTIRSFDDLHAFGIAPTQRQRNEVEKRMHGGTRSFAEAWAAHFCDDKFGESTTHWRKLDDRVLRGVGNPCPLLLIGIPPEVIAA
jgi:Restriction endonuclease BglII